MIHVLLSINMQDTFFCHDRWNYHNYIKKIEKLYILNVPCVYKLSKMVRYAWITITYCLSECNRYICKNLIIMQYMSPSTQVYIHSRHYTKDEDTMTIQKYDTWYSPRYIYLQGDSWEVLGVCYPGRAHDGGWGLNTQD